MPQEDKHLYTKSKFEDELCSLLGGHVAEEVTFGEVTTGASNDIEKATRIAQRMVTEYGMSTLGPITLGEKSHELFLGRDIMHTKNYSEETASKIDQEVKKILSLAYEKAKDIIKKNKNLLVKIAEDLFKKETLTREEFMEFFKGKKLAPAKIKS